MNNIKLYQNKTPQGPGKYFWRCTFSGTLSLITIVNCPSTKTFGVKNDTYLGVLEHRGGGVDKLSGLFSDKLTFNCDI